MARLDPDEVTRWETFVRLVKEGQSPTRSPTPSRCRCSRPAHARARQSAAAHPRPLPPREDRRLDVRHLTLASKAQQKDWLALWDAPRLHCPTGWQLRGWLFGGQAICASYALFDVEASGLALVADLFGEQRYIADADAFWTAQNAAIEAPRRLSRGGLERCGRDRAAVRAFPGLGI
jgi:ParB family chromosome partitioning protein